MALMVQVMTKHLDINKYVNLIASAKTCKYVGKITQIVGLALECAGVNARMGDICRIYSSANNSNILADVVGFKENKLLLMPLGDLKGVAPNDKVISTGETLRVPVGMGLLGRVIDVFGEPMDDKGELIAQDTYPIDNQPPNPLKREPIKEVLPLGVKAIDSLLTLGMGQRIGIFAGSGVGKSTLLGMIAKNATADVNVIVLIGERGREVRSFLENDLKEEGLKRSVVVIATSDQPALIRLKSASVGTSIAEYFRDKGLNVLLMMDSLTRFAMAQREIGMAIGEPPVSRGYTPSVYAIMPKLLERSGTAEQGSITGLYTVLVEGDDMNEPISDTVRGILDGHIVLSRSLANSNHYPAIDVLASVSRLMPEIASKEHNNMAGIVRNMLHTYKRAQDLIAVGAYKKGTDREIDCAIDHLEPINSLLRQNSDEKFSLEQTLEQLKSITEGCVS